MLDKFRSLVSRYDVFYDSFFVKGLVPVADTAVGTWGCSVAVDVFDFFKRFGLKNFSSFVDLGSGDGKVVLIASLFTSASGFEFDRDLHDTAVKIRDELNLKASFFQKDFFCVDLSQFDFLFINPDKGFHLGLEDKLLKEMKDDAVLVVYNNIFLPRFLSRKQTFWFAGIPIIIYTKK